MIKRSIGLVVVAMFIGACSSAPVVPTLNGKKRERINTIVYETPPLVVVDPVNTNAERLSMVPRAPAKKKSIPIVTQQTPITKSKPKPAQVVVDKSIKATDVISIVEKPEIDKTGAEVLAEGTLNKAEPDRIEAVSVAQERGSDVATAAVVTPAETAEPKVQEGNAAAAENLAIPLKNVELKETAVTTDEPSDVIAPVKVRAVKVEEDVLDLSDLE